MANCKVNYVRFFPVEPGHIDADLTQSIVQELADELSGWEIFYHQPAHGKWFDLVYTNKSTVRMQIFDRKDLWEAFHVWVRIADEGGMHDLVGFRSRHYALTGRQDPNPIVRRWGHYLQPWDYLRSCLYMADTLRLQFSGTGSDLLSRLTKTPVWDQIPPDLAEDLSWSHGVDVLHYKCSYVFVDHKPYNGKATNLDFYADIPGRSRAEMSKVLLDDDRILLRDVLMRPSWSWKPEDNPRIDPLLLSFELRHLGKMVYRWEWGEDEIGEGWQETTSHGWDNCIDPEYLKFLAWYGK